MPNYDAVNSEICSVRNLDNNACVIFASALPQSVLDALLDLSFRTRLIEEPFQLHVWLPEAVLVTI